MEKIIEKVLKKILPTKKETKKMKSLTENCLKYIQEICKEYEYKIEPMLVGSVTRNTWLRDKWEFDIFLLFDKNLEKNVLESVGIEIGKRFCEKFNGKASLEYAEHPYVKCVKNNLSIDIVPCFKVDSPKELKSSVDRTPFHVEYLSKKINEKNSNEVRLLKKFLINNFLYGSDVKTSGFSGFLCELLIIKYGSFIELLKNASKWEYGTVIDLENYYENENEVRKKFKSSALIVIDPIDKERNCAAALSVENFFYFKKLAKEFLNKPSEKFFFGGKIFKEKIRNLIKKRKTKMLLIKFKKPNISEEIIYSQLKSFADRIKSILEEKKYEFQVIGTSVSTDGRNCYVFLEISIHELPSIQKRIGPPVYDIKNYKNFLEKYKNAFKVYIENNRWVAIVKRNFENVKEKLIDSLKEKKEILIAKGIPSYIAESISKKFEIIEDLKIEKYVKKLNRMFFEYFEKDLK
ncbi:MAG: CCA tRNA nucleotidyltransferase [Candidatus Aenigmatarchaeota archaeon]